MTPKPADPPFPPSSRLEVRVLYADTDMMGVVYHATYLRWFEAGRGDYMRRRGVSYAAIERSGLALPVVEAHAVFKKPAVYDDLLEVSTRVGELGGARVRFDYGISRGLELLVTGHTWHAAVIRGKGPIRLPVHLKNALLASETAPRSER
ncbi:MAG: thioesterase family protein [Deltaproteobacteria bacterium]|nr:thioesterase family protein [Deltaproteobacteria bacterium]